MTGLSRQRVSTREQINFTFSTDVSSVEIFGDDGLTVTTALFFPDTPLTKMKIKTPGVVIVEHVEIKQLHDIWREPPPLYLGKRFRIFLTLLRPKFLRFAGLMVPH